MNKTFVLADVKTVEGKDASGEFEAILSAATIDRDGEIIDVGAFDPLPESIPVHAYHDFRDPVGRAAPFYDGEVLKVRGVFASTPRAQEIRTLVTEGIIGSMSVGFMGASHEEHDGVVHITKAEILEGSFVSIPSNREAAVLAAKSYAELGAGVLSVEEARAAFDEVTSKAGDEPVTPDTDPDDEAAVSAAASKEAPADTPAEPEADVDEEQLKALEAEVLGAEIAALARL